MKTLILILALLLIIGCCKEAVKDDIPKDTDIIKRNIERQKKFDSLKNEVKK